MFGDSSGGNYSICLTQWIIEKNNLKPPSILSLSYPFVRFRKILFTPSSIESFEDMMINYNLALIVLEFYLEDTNIFK